MEHRRGPKALGGLGRLAGLPIALVALALGLASVGVQGHERTQPLEECYGGAKTRQDVGPCLDRKLAEARKEHLEVIRQVRAEADRLDKAIGRKAARPAFEAALRDFLKYRDSACKWEASMLASGSGAGDVEKSCEVFLTVQRTGELRATLPVPGKR